MELIYLLFSCPQLCAHNCVWHLNCVRQCVLTIATQDNPADLWQLRHWLQFLQLRTWIHDNLCYLTIKSDTGQHSQFLRCFILQDQKNILVATNPRISHFRQKFNIYLASDWLLKTLKCVAPTRLLLHISQFSFVIKASKIKLVQHKQTSIVL